MDIGHLLELRFYELIVNFIKFSFLYSHIVLFILFFARAKKRTKQEKKTAGRSYFA